jgi:hypothetical protein
MILPSENLPHVLDTWSLVGDAGQEERRIGFLIDEKRDPASFCVGIGIAGDLRDGGGDARLVLLVETQQSRDLPGSLTCGYHIILGVDRNRENGECHPISPV